MYYNPQLSQIIISDANLKNSVVKVFNIYGQVIKTYQFTEMDAIIDVGSVANGMCFEKMQESSSGLIKSKILILFD